MDLKVSGFELRLWVYKDGNYDLNRYFNLIFRGCGERFACESKINKFKENSKYS
jgi:hypothetical protein